jgi:glycosyltransferase involved in cell wall biosynthesis
MSLISIVMPAFNAEKYIGQALRSVEAQTYKEWELIIVDDCSTDMTGQIIMDFKKNITRPVICYRHERNKGLSSARNSGVKRSSGDLIAFLDADDYWDPRHLEFVMPHFSLEPVGLVHSGSILFDDKTGEVIRKRAPTKSHIEMFPRSLYGGGYIIQPSSAVVKRKIFDTIGYFDECLNPDICDDLDLWIRIAKAGYKIVYSGNDTCYYRKHIEAMSADGPNLVKSSGTVYLKHMGWRRLPWLYRHAVAARTLSNAGKMCFKAQPDESSRLFFLAWMALPFNLLNLAYAAMSLGTFLFRRKIKRD